MTQIRKAFEEAARQNALKNFNSEFRTRLYTTADKTIPEEISDSNISPVTTENLLSLKPAKALSNLIFGIENAMEDIFATARYKAYIKSYNRACGKVYNRTLFHLENPFYRNRQSEIIAEFLQDHGSPAAVFDIADKIFQALFAQTLYDKLVTAAEKEPDGDFSKMLDNLTDETVIETLITLNVRTYKAMTQPYVLSFSQQFISELTTVYKAKDSHEHLNNALNSVLSAYANRR